MRYLIFYVLFLTELIVQSCLTLCNSVNCSHKAPLPTGFSRQEYWSVLPLSSPGDLPKPGIEPMSPALAGGFFTTEPPGKPSFVDIFVIKILILVFSNFWL